MSTGQPQRGLSRLKSRFLCCGIPLNMSSLVTLFLKGQCADTVHNMKMQTDWDLHWGVINLFQYDLSWPLQHPLLLYFLLLTAVKSVCHTLLHFFIRQSNLLTHNCLPTLMHCSTINFICTKPSLEDVFWTTVWTSAWWAPLFNHHVNMHVFFCFFVFFLIWLQPDWKQICWCALLKLVKHHC